MAEDAEAARGGAPLVDRRRDVALPPARRRALVGVVSSEFGVQRGRLRVSWNTRGQERPESGLGPPLVERCCDVALPPARRRALPEVEDTAREEHAALPELHRSAQEPLVLPRERAQHLCSASGLRFC